MTQAALAFEPQPRAVFSPCTRHDRPCPEACIGRLYRYQLHWPTRHQNHRIALWILANPSTATASELDPTVRRCFDFSQRWGFGWCAIGNVRAWRETDPDLVPRDSTAIGPDNDHHLAELVRMADLVVCGWGKLGGDRGEHALDLVRGLGKVPHALHLNKDGSPQHPLYLSGSLTPFLMEGQ